MIFLKILKRVDFLKGMFARMNVERKLRRAGFSERTYGSAMINSIGIERKNGHNRVWEVIAN